MLRTRKALTGLKAGDILAVLCTDPLAAIDIPHLVAERGDSLIGSSAEDGVMTFIVQRQTTDPSSSDDRR